ncbi:MAG: hydrolase [Novosphingobium sp.]
MQQLSSTERGLIDTIDAAAMLAHVQRWCAVNTGTGNLPGLARQWDMLADAFAVLPGAIRKADPAPVRTIAPDGTGHETANGAHLVLSVRPDAPRRYLLTGHMDTVFGPDHPFQSLQWLDARTLNGPGVADMKGGIAVILAALCAFEASPVAAGIGYDVLINSDEETGSLASAPLIAELARGKAAALTYEPSALPDGTLAAQRPGSGNYAAVIRGRSAHAGRNPHEGRNAILAASDLALRLKALEREGLTVNPARIDGGSASNVVPDLAVLRFNVRPASAELAADLAENLAKLVENLEKVHEVSVHLHGGLTRPPKPLTEQAKSLFALVRECGEALGQPVRWQASGGVCDGNNIAACGVPVVDTMGVRGGAIHSDREFLIVPSLAERAALSALVLHRLSGGNQ